MKFFFDVRLKCGGTWHRAKEEKLHMREMEEYPNICMSLVSSGFHAHTNKRRLEMPSNANENSLIFYSYHFLPEYVRVCSMDLQFHWKFEKSASRLQSKNIEFSSLYFLLLNFSFIFISVSSISRSLSTQAYCIERR